MKKTVLKIFFCVLVFNHVTAAPSEVKLEDIAEVTQAEVTTESNPTTLLEEVPQESPEGVPEQAQSQRQKRWYNFYGFPPANPTYYDGENSFYPGGFGQQQDPLALIHRRLQDISNSFRQPPPSQFPQVPTPQFPPQFPPGFPQFPSFVPIFYIPPTGCACNPQRPNNRPRPPQDNNPNGTDPDGVFNRWPEMEDDRQNWGIVNDNNNNQNNIGEGDGDGSRPISLNPIEPIGTMNRPSPPVEHGSVEGNITSGTVGDTGNNGFGTPATTFRPLLRPQPLQPPSNCDSAILRCCHLPQVTIECFSYQGCPDPSSYGNPCDSGVIARVIDRFLMFYGQRNG